MSNFQSWKINKTIEESIAKGLSYKWHYPNIHERALLTTIITIKEAPRVNVTRLNLIDKMISTYHIFFKLLALNFIFYSDKSKILNSKLSMKDLADERIDNIFKHSRDSLIDQIQKNLDEKHFETYKVVLKNAGNDAKLYCFLFLLIANDNNLLNDLLEEYYLIKEIDAFRILKE